MVDGCIQLKIQIVDHPFGVLCVNFDLEFFHTYNVDSNIVKGTE